MVYRPYNLLGPKLINAIVAEVEAARDAGSRAIVIRSGLRHFSAGADLDIFDKRVAAGEADQSKEGRRPRARAVLRLRRRGHVCEDRFRRGDAWAAPLAWRHPASGAEDRGGPRQGNV